jgi:hypothetical protein
VPVLPLLVLEPPVLEPPLVLEPLLPCCRHRSRSLPVRPTHWLLEEEPPVPALPELLPPEAELPPELDPEPPLEPSDPDPVLDPDEPPLAPLEPSEPPLEPLDPDPMLEPVDPDPALDPDEPPLAPEEPPLPAPPPCAQATLATPTSAAVTAALITLSFTMSLLFQKKAEYAALPGCCKSNAAPGAAVRRSVVPATPVVAVRRRRAHGAARACAGKINPHSLHDSGMAAAASERTPDFLSPPADMRRSER